MKALRAQSEKHGRLPARLATAPLLPEPFTDVWGFYLDLERKRLATAMGDWQPITWQDIKAWREEWGVRLTHDELELIDALDETFREVWSTHAKAERDRAKANAPAPRRRFRR